MSLLKRALFFHTSMFITFIHSKEVKYYSSFNWDNNVKLGAESSISDFISLANDPRSSLPDSFTVCSSLLVNFVNQKIHFIEMYKEDGSHWFSLTLAVPDGLALVIRFYYEDPVTGSNQQEDFSDPPSPIVPHSW